MVAKVGDCYQQVFISRTFNFCKKKSEESLKNLKTCRVTNLGLEFFYFCQTFWNLSRDPVPLYSVHKSNFLVSPSCTLSPIHSTQKLKLQGQQFVWFCRLYNVHVLLGNHIEEVHGLAELLPGGGEGGGGGGGRGVDHMAASWYIYLFSASLHHHCRKRITMRTTKQSRSCEKPRFFLTLVD